MKLTLPIALLLFAAPVAAQDLPEKATDSLWRNDALLKALTTVKPHSLTDIRTRPDAYRGIPVELEIQFHETRKGGNPFFTRFTDDNYLCFSAWGAEQPLWHKEEYQKDFGFLFVDRNSALFRTLLEAKLYSRLKITAQARDIFRGIPYVEVIKAEILDNSISEATIMHGAKAQKLAQQGDTAGSISEFERALRGDMTPLAKAQLHIDLAQVYLQRDDRDNVNLQLDNAKKLQPNDVNLAKSIEKIKNTPLNMLKLDGLKEVPAELRDNNTQLAASRPATGLKEASGNTKNESTPVPAPANPKTGSTPNK